MKVVCNGLDLSDAVMKVVKAVSTKTTNPILEGIKIVAKENILTLTATDLELTIEKKIIADVIIEGQVVVPGRYFSDFVKKLNQEEIELVLNENKLLKIKYTDSEGQLQCFDESEYPEVYKMEGSESFSMVQNDFKELIKKIIFSVSNDDSRPVLKGTLLKIEGHEITAVALDGYRLALAKSGVEQSTKDMKIVVPARSLNEIGKILSENDDEHIMVKVSNNYLLVDKGDTKIITRLIEGDFINYKQIIPSEFSTEVTINKQFFENGLERASIMSKNERNNLVKFDIKEKVLTLISNSEIGNIKEKITIGMKGRELDIAFNSKYYSDCLKVINEEFIKISLNSQVSPCIITPTHDDSYLYLILPVRINS